MHRGESGRHFAAWRFFGEWLNQENGTAGLLPPFAAGGQRDQNYPTLREGTT